jgi:hypothetical protein
LTLAAVNDVLNFLMSKPGGVFVEPARTKVALKCPLTPPSVRPLTGK